MSTHLTDEEREALADILGAELYETLMESTADQWRRWRYLTDFAKEQYRAEAERIIVGAFMPAVERIVAAREAKTLRDAASDVVADCSNQPGPCICVARDWLAARADQIGGQR